MGLRKRLLFAILLAVISVIPHIATAFPEPPSGGSYVYPNPAKDCCVHIAYRMEEAGSAEVRVYQEAGDLVATMQEAQTSGLQKITIPLCRLAPGCYFYRVILRYRSGRVATLPNGHFAVTKR